VGAELWLTRAQLKQAKRGAGEQQLAFNEVRAVVLQGKSSFLSHGSFTGMEELIAHFKAYTEGRGEAASGFAYAAVEAPKGELGVQLVVDGTARPYRLKVRTPVAHNLHLIPSLGSGVFFADFVASFCSLDVVFGEIDR
jgi:NADH:ubiquinone oxidoreductase subunit D